MTGLTTVNHLSKVARFFIGFAVGGFFYVLLLCVAVHGWSGKGTEPHIWGNYVLAGLFWPYTCLYWVIIILVDMSNRTQNTFYDSAGNIVCLVSMGLSILWAPVLGGLLSVKYLNSLIPVGVRQNPDQKNGNLPEEDKK